MPKIKNGGLDQYGEVYSLNGIGDERVNGIGLQFCCRLYTPISILQSGCQTARRLIIFFDIRVRQPFYFRRTRTSSSVISGVLVKFSSV